MENPTETEKRESSEQNAPPAKKRGAERQMRKEDDEEDNIQEEDTGSFQKADSATIAARRKVTVRRKGQPSGAPAATEEKPIAWPTFNFTPTEDKGENKESKKEEDKTTAAPLFSTPSTSNSDTFSFSTQFTWKSTSSPATFSIPIPSFPPVTTGTPSLNTTGSGIFGENIAKPSSLPEPAADQETTSPSPVKPKLDLPTEPVSTGEEGEHHVFQNRMKVFILEGAEWKERGVGQLKLNVADDNSYARLIMRAEGALRLVLNVRLFPAMKIEPVGDKAARFIAPHIDKPSELATYLVRAAKPENIKDLIATVESHKTIKGSDTPKKEETKAETPKKEEKKAEPTQEKATTEGEEATKKVKV